MKARTPALTHVSWDMVRMANVTQILFVSYHTYNNNDIIDVKKICNRLAKDFLLKCIFLSRIMYFQILVVTDLLTQCSVHQLKTCVFNFVD